MRSRERSRQDSPGCDHRDTILLVARMMEYRMKRITCLERNVQAAILEIKARGNLTSDRRTEEKISLLLHQIEQLARDNHFDADSLAVILRSAQDEGETVSKDAYDDLLRYYA